MSSLHQHPWQGHPRFAAFSLPFVPLPPHKYTPPLLLLHTQQAHLFVFCCHWLQRVWTSTAAVAHCFIMSACGRMCGGISRGKGIAAVLLAGASAPWTHPPAAGSAPAARPGHHPPCSLGCCCSRGGGLPPHCASACHASHPRV